MSKNRAAIGKWGLIGTIVYIAVLLIIVWLNWSKFSSLEPNAWGDFLAGTFGPLALGWVVLGFFLQSKELQNSVDALNLQTAELKNSVEQQKAMVGVTEKQLQLDIEVREEQAKISISKDLPFIQLRGGGSSGAGKSHQYRYYLKNVGATCTEGYMSLAENDDLKLLRSGIPYIDANSEFEFYLVSKNGRKMDILKTYSLELVTINIRNQKRVQRFDLGLREPKLTWCDPEIQ